MGSSLRSPCPELVLERAVLGDPDEDNCEAVTVAYDWSSVLPLDPSLKHRPNTERQAIMRTTNG
jgi:hypothetical protein